LEFRRVLFRSEEAIKVASDIGYPVLVRPSYVIGGSRMEIVYEESELHTYIEKYPDINEGEPLLIDQYVTGIEVDVDAISDGKTTIVPGIMEHVERSGVHSGDSIVVYPQQRVNEDEKKELYETSEKIEKEQNVM